MQAPQAYPAYPPYPPLPIKAEKKAPSFLVTVLLCLAGFIVGTLLALLAMVLMRVIVSQVGNSRTMMMMMLLYQVLPYAFIGLGIGLALGILYPKKLPWYALGGLLAALIARAVVVLVFSRPVGLSSAISTLLVILIGAILYATAFTIVRGRWWFFPLLLAAHVAFMYLFNLVLRKPLYMSLMQFVKDPPFRMRDPQLFFNGTFMLVEALLLGLAYGLVFAIADLIDKPKQPATLPPTPQF